MKCCWLLKVCRAFLSTNTVTTCTLGTYIVGTLWVHRHCNKITQCDAHYQVTCLGTKTSGHDIVYRIPKSCTDRKQQTVHVTPGGAYQSALYISAPQQTIHGQSPRLSVSIHPPQLGKEGCGMAEGTQGILYEKP